MDSAGITGAELLEARLMEHEEPTCWYAVCCKPRQEAVAEALLQSDCTSFQSREVF